MLNAYASNRGKGGKRLGAGRKTDLFRKKMLSLSDSPAAWKFRRDVIEGNPIEERMIVDPDNCRKVTKALVTPSIENRRKMLADIDDRAHGKSAQAVALTDGDGLPLVVKVVNFASANIAKCDENDIT